ncbi:V-type ATPase 116kDa subunit family protein [Treponema sp.]|uniref:V-type ATP synthase subunit I n=1 Tax=Treponema sp. TaxID=166 RepID=UPI0025DA5896|nr:V-type ATPase 116kDa subunit family protein [Treponema sp.]MCR5218794.1 ATPase [Treponema sp.]
MAKTTPMRLLELMILKDDIDSVLTYLGKLGDFQFQQDFDSAAGEDKKLNPDTDIFARLQSARSYLNIEDLDHFTEAVSLPSQEERGQAVKLYTTAEDLHNREVECGENLKRIAASYKEASSFSNLKVPYSQLESLSFLTLRIGRIEEGLYDSLASSLGSNAILTTLGNDKSKILAASSKKGRFFMDSELKKAGFVEIKLPKDFKGVPDELLKALEGEVNAAKAELEEVQLQRKNFAETHKDMLLHLLQSFSVSSQLNSVKNKLESTDFVYRITGWIPAWESRSLIRTLDDLTKGRAGIREFLPGEVRSVIEGREKVPVQLKHGSLIKSFQRLIFSYGSPLYGTVDPTPFVAVFFTVLFGIMFGDAGQGLVFLLLGILMTLNKMKLAGWEKFGRIFICIGISSMIMGLLTGEFFASEEVLKPFNRFVHSLAGVTDYEEASEPILKLMPNGTDSSSVVRMFMFFGFTIAVGFVINTCGIIINIVNQFALNHKGRALFGKTGITGAIFFWYVIIFAVLTAFGLHKPALYDVIIIGVSLFFTAFGEVFERLVDGERPVFENGLFSAVISAVVEVIEIISSYLSNTVSFVRVGAFALAHAVLGSIISTMMAQVPAAAGKMAVLVAGNAIVIVLEGMIVAIQVVRLQYYEFFSKFFTETGREFKPFAFVYNCQRQ